MARNHKEEARQYYAICTLTCFLIFGLLSILLLIFVGPLAKLLGASGEVAPYTKQYLIGFLITFAPQVVGLNVLQFFNVIGKPSLATKWMLVVNAVGIGIEYVLIFVCKLGMIGAAIGYASPFVLLCAIIIFFQKDKNAIFKITKKDIIPDWSKFGQVVVRGLPMFLTSLTAAIGMVYINNLRMAMGMGVAIGAAFGISQGYFKSGVSILTQGIFKGFAPLFSYNYGAGHYDRARAIYKMYLVRTFLIMAVIVVLLCIFARPLGLIFSGGDPEVAELTKTITIFYLGMFPLGILSRIVSSYYACIGNTIKGIIVGSSKDFWVFVVVAFVVSKIFTGSQFLIFGGISDLITGIIAILFAWYELRKIKRQEHL